MNIEELQAAVDKWDVWKGYVRQAITNEDFEVIDILAKAARLVANPNIEAAAIAIDKLVGMADIEPHVGPPPAVRIREAKAAIAAAFTTQGATDD